MRCSTSPRASQRQSVSSATAPRARATTQAAECQPAPTTLPLPRMLPGTPATHTDVLSECNAEFAVGAQINATASQDQQSISPVVFA